jgi:hypothetical protein
MKKQRVLTPEAIFNGQKLAWQERILTDRKLTTASKLLGCYLTHFFRFDRGGHAWASVKTYADDLKINEKTVRRSIQSLHEHGWIVVHRGRRGWSGTNKIEPNFQHGKVPSGGGDVREDADNSAPSRLATPLAKNDPTVARSPGTPRDGDVAKSSENKDRRGPHEFPTGSVPVPNSAPLNSAQFPTGEETLESPRSKVGGNVRKMTSRNTASESVTRAANTSDTFPGRDADIYDPRCGHLRPRDADTGGSQFLYDSLSNPIGRPNQRQETKIEPPSFEECTRLADVEGFDPTTPSPQLKPSQRECAHWIAKDLMLGNSSRFANLEVRKEALRLVWRQCHTPELVA